MPAILKRSIIYAVEGGVVVARDLGAIGDAAKRTEGAIVQGAANSNSALKGTGDAAGAMSGAVRQHFTQAGQDLGRFFDSVNSGRGVLQALTIEAPKILDVFGNPWLTAAAIAGGAIAAIVQHMGLLGQSSEEATKEADKQTQATDRLMQSFGVSTKSAEGYANSIALLSGVQKDLVSANLAVEIDKQGAAFTAAGAKLDDLIRKTEVYAKTSAGVGAGVEFGPQQPEVAPVTNTLANDLQKQYAAFKAGADNIDELRITFEKLKESQGATAEEAQKAGAEFVTEATAARQVEEALKLANAQFDILHGRASQTEIDFVNLTKAQQESVAALQKYDFAGQLQNAMKTADLIEKSGRPDAAQIANDLLTSVEAGIQDTKAALAKDRTKNQIELSLGVDSTEAGKLVTQLQEAATKGGTLAEQIERVRQAGEAAGASTQVINKAVATLTQQYNAAALSAAKAAEEQRLVAAGLSPERAQQVLSLTNQVNAGLDERHRILAQIADLETAANALPAKRAQIEQEIVQLRGQLATLDEKDAQALQNQEDANQKTLDNLKARLAQLQGRTDPQGAIAAAVKAAVESVKPPTLEELDKPGGAEALEHAEAMRQDAAATAEATERLILRQQALGSLRTASEQFALVQEQLDADEKAGIITSEEKTAALERERQKTEQLARQQAVQDALMRGGVAGGLKAGLLQVETTSADVAKGFAQDFTSAYDQVNDAAVQWIDGQKTGLDTLKSALFSFATGLEKVALEYGETEFFKGILGLAGGGLGGLLGFLGFGGAPGTSFGFESALAAGGNATPFHAGGLVGDGGGVPRNLPAWLVAGAPRLHGGGLFGPDERPAVLLTGERVLNRAETRAYDAGVSAPVFHVTNNYNISGVNDPALLRGIVEASAAKANDDLERRFRNNPSRRRASFGH